MTFGQRTSLKVIQDLRSTLYIIHKLSLYLVLALILWQGLGHPAGTQAQVGAGQALQSHFLKKEISQKNGELSFNVVRVLNPTGEAIRLKPLLELPEGWAIFSTSFVDTVVAAHDSISLAFRIRIPEKLSSDTTHQIFFRAYAHNNAVLTESSFLVKPVTYHFWEVTVPAARVFFLPGTLESTFEINVSNRGNTRESIAIKLGPDTKLSLKGADDWLEGRQIILPPYTDTVIRVNVHYEADKNRIFDVGKVQVTAEGQDKMMIRSVFVEKYSDEYAPLVIDRSLPHQTEAGFRTFKGNTSLLPFIKARGSMILNKNSSFKYNFTFYDITEREDYIGNTYYSFMYSWKTLKVGLGAFSSELGRNMFSRNALVVSNTLQLTPIFSMQAFVSQSILTPKTSVALGYGFSGKKLGLNGSFAYDNDRDRGINTSTIILRSGTVRLFKTHVLTLNLYGYKETHDLKNDYSLMGYAWDFSYGATFGNHFMVQLANSYGSPEVPGPQMGLLSYSGYVRFYLNNTKRYFSTQYVNGRRDYFTYNFEGVRQPDIHLEDQYANILFHSHANTGHTWQAGPSAERYMSLRPSTTTAGVFNEFRSLTFRMEYKSVLWQRLVLDLKAGYSDLYASDEEVPQNQRVDFHLTADYSFGYGIGASLRYDYGPMVSSGLYQFAGDSKNHSINIGPTLYSSYFKERVSVNLSTNLIYRIDMDYLSANINPKVETYVARDWYVIVGGTYNFTRQEYMKRDLSSSHYYLELSVKKRWGKSEIDKWQKDTRKLKIILFKDENGNGVKDYGEKGVPYVKTRIRLTNAPVQDPAKSFPVDITLLSNEEGVVSFNQLPVGFYELVISPLSDVKEYFYVDRGSEKLELTGNAVYYIPFQKANRIMGKINLTREQFVKEGTEVIDLENIKVTAYNNQGNSYSSFTLKDGSFTIFVPGGNTYYIRIPNVFGKSFKILRNDIILAVSDSTSNRVEFDVVESSRQIVFKKAQPAQADTAESRPLKIKVLHGKFYENPALDSVDVNAAPEFHIQFAPPREEVLEQGLTYVVLTDAITRDEAVSFHRILDENGITATLGLDPKTGKYYVFSGHYTGEDAARKEAGRLKTAGMKNARVLRYE